MRIVHKKTSIAFIAATLLLVSTAFKNKAAVNSVDIVEAILFDAKGCDSILIHQQYAGDTVFVTNEWLNSKSSNSSKFKISDTTIFSAGLTFIFTSNTEIREVAKRKSSLPIIFYKIDSDSITVSFIRLDNNKDNKLYGNKKVKIQKKNGKTNFVLLNNNLYCVENPSNYHQTCYRGFCVELKCG